MWDTLYKHLRPFFQSPNHILKHVDNNISILDIAARVNTQIPSEVIVTPSNDPRSYRLSSKKLLSTGFTPQHSVNDGIQDVIAAYRDGRLRDEERYYNIKTMKKLTDLS